MEPRLRVAVVGAAGRMGRHVLGALTPAEGFEIVAAVDRAAVGAPVRSLAVGGDPESEIATVGDLGEALDAGRPDMLVDFSVHPACVANAEMALRAGCSPVVGATGFHEEELVRLDGVAREAGTPGIYCPNFALGAVLMMRFAEEAARWLPDCEIVELHHDRKADSPSGTAVRNTELVTAARRASPTALPPATERVPGARGAELDGVRLHSVRLRGFVAHQEVIFGGVGEVLTIRHDSLDRSSFMHGVKLACRSVRRLEGFQVGLDQILDLS